MEGGRERDYHDLGYEVNKKRTAQNISKNY
jgi:hypothetical protein